MTNENLQIVDKLSNLLVENQLENKFQFIFSTSPNGFSIELQEIYETGQSFLVFNSNDSIPDTIEELYEKNIFSYEEMIIKVIQHNIRNYMTFLKEIKELTYKL